MSEVALLRNGGGVCDGPIAQVPGDSAVAGGDKNPTLHLHVVSLGTCSQVAE